MMYSLNTKKNGLHVFEVMNQQQITLATYYITDHSTDTEVHYIVQRASDNMVIGDAYNIVHAQQMCKADYHK